MSVFGEDHPVEVLRRVDWWLVVVASALALVGLTFIHSATRYDPDFAGQEMRQALFLAVSAGMGIVLILVPYARIMRLAWVLYAAALMALALLPWLGVTLSISTLWGEMPETVNRPVRLRAWSLSGFRTMSVMGTLGTTPTTFVRRTSMLLLVEARTWAL